MSSPGERVLIGAPCCPGTVTLTERNRSGVTDTGQGDLAGKGEPVSRWDRVIPWLHEHDLEVFLVPFLLLVMVGLCNC